MFNVILKNNERVFRKASYDTLDKANEWANKYIEKHLKDFNVEIEIKEVIPDYKELRVIEYSKQDNLDMEAIKEYLFEGRDEKLKEQSQKRIAIKEKYPKPQ